MTAPPSGGVCRCIEGIEAESAFSQHQLAPDSEVRRMRMSSFRLGTTTLVLTAKSANVYYNRWIAAGTRSPATEQQLDQVVELARAHRVPSVAVSVTPRTAPRMLASWLKARGFVRMRPSAKLWRDGSPLRRRRAPEGVHVVRVGPREAPVWVDVVSQVWRSFGYRRPWFEARARAPGWHHFLAWIGDDAVGAGALFVGDVGAVRAGHLVEGVTLRAFRRRGIQAAIIRKRISTARRLGCTVLTSETAPPLPRMPLVSFRNLRREGFALAYFRDSWRLNLR